MPLLSATGLSKSYGPADIFKDLTFSIPNRARIGLVGANGVGKTTLLRVLMGQEESSEGGVQVARGVRIGYLPQRPNLDTSRSIWQECLSAFADLIEQQAEVARLEHAMAAEPGNQALLDAYGRVQMDFERRGGYTYETRMRQTLAGLGFQKEDYARPLNQSSGGQQTRAFLARLLLSDPDLLLLDEPTNHLDIEAIEWLERIPRAWEGAVLIVSHDRFFLDNTVNTIWEMTPAGIENYSGNYSAYLVQRQERWEYYERVFTEEKARLLNEVDFVQRNWVRASTHARALGLLRRLGRDLAIVENYGIMALRSGKKWSEYDADTIRGTDRPLDVIDAIRKVNAISMTSARPPAIRPRLASDSVSGTMVLRAQNVTIGYPGNTMFTIHNLELRRGECAALIGPNGSGKTTLLKTLLGQMEPLKGALNVGASLKIGYFAQAHDSLNGDLSVIDQLLAHKEMDAEKARNHLAQYLFRGEDVFKPVSALSGGERARLALAILSLDGSNLLLLDEPTNHLDIPAREALQEVLENFSGTILLVSHDRYLIDRLATHIWELRDDHLQVFNGTYREFVLRRAVKPGANSKANRLILTEKPLARDNSRETRQRMQSLEMIEERIREQENAIQRLSGELQKAGVAQHHEKVHKLSWQVAQAQAALEKLMSEWDKLAV